MADELILNEITFSYSLWTLGSLLFVPAVQLASLPVPILALGAGILATFLIVVQPVQRIGKRIALSRLGLYIKDKTITGITILGNQSAPSKSINIDPISKQAVNSRIITREANLLAGIFYFIIILALVLGVVPKQLGSIDPLISNWFWLSIAADFAVVVAVFFTLWVFWRRSVNLPKFICLTIVYLLQVQGELARATSFDRYENAILQNDWITARYYALQAHQEGVFDYSPDEIQY